MKICVVTPSIAAGEPRAARHAIAVKEALPDAEVVFIDFGTRASTTADPVDLRATKGIIRQTIYFPSRQNGFLELAWRKLKVKAARLLMRLSGVVTEPLFGDRMIGLTKQLKRAKADLYIAHNIETLLPAARAARDHRAQLIFDCMEYYSDVGDCQTPGEARAARQLERTWLPQCDLVLASSETLAHVLAAQYRIPPPLALYNTPKVVAELHDSPKSHLRLYWRNTVIGFGQRGLEDVLIALTKLPEDVTLSLQGRTGTDGGHVVRSRIKKLGLERRVTILPPYQPGDAVHQAAQHAVGLCLERLRPVNHLYTVSNKLFDYMMGGLVVVAADLPGLRSIVERSRGGLLFEPGSPDHLAEQIGRLRADPDMRAELAANARAFALAAGNLEIDMARFKAALLGVVARKEVPTISLALETH